MVVVSGPKSSESLPAESGIVVQVSPSFIVYCHPATVPVWPVKWSVAGVPLQMVPAPIEAVPPTLAGMVVTVALPFMLAVSPESTSVATTVYVPMKILLPKLIVESVPTTADPLFAPFFWSW